MKRLAIGGGAYEERGANDRPTGRFWARPLVDKHRTWRLLKANARRAAIAEVNDASFRPATDDFAAVADVYIRAGCPTKFRSWKQATPEYQKAEARHVQSLNGYFARTAIDSIYLADLLKYRDWRVHGHPEGRLTRAVDKDIQTLSNVLNFAVFITRQLRLNPIHSNRSRFHKTRSHATDRMPESADQIHALAERFFGSVRSEVFGWMCYFAMFTGCRSSELLRLRWTDTPGEPGRIIRCNPFPHPEFKGIYTGVGFLELGRRSKQHRHKRAEGQNPECVIWPEFADMLDGFSYWRAQRYPGSEFFFPALNGAAVVGAVSFGHALARECRVLGFPKITPHGFRSYFATKLHRDGFRDEDIAEAIGDRTVGLVAGVYRQHGRGVNLGWLPTSGLPGWQRWRPLVEKVIELRR